MVEKNSGIGLYMEKISSTGKANISGYVRAKTGRTYIKVKLQKLSGNTWISVKSWEYSSSATLNPFAPKTKFNYGWIYHK